jgi:serine protease AprX
MLMVMLALTTISSMALGESPRLSRELEQLPANQVTDVIVQYGVRPTNSHFERILSRGGSMKTDLRAMRAGAFHVPASALAEMANDPDVKYISPDRPVRSTAFSNNPDYYDYASNAFAGWWNSIVGTGVGIAVIDSGISWRGDFGNRIVYNQSFVKGENYASDPYGHGTHVAGILAGDGADSTGWSDYKTFMGVANNANLINLRVLDENGEGSDSGVIAAIQAAIALKYAFNIRVINLSLGRAVHESYQDDPLDQAVETAWKAGIVVVVAAGNDGRDNAAGTNGYGTINSPGNDPYVITVGAMKPNGTPTRTDDTIASYSSKGPTLFDHVVKPDIVAAGNFSTSVVASTRAVLYTPLNTIPYWSYITNGSNAASNAYMRLSGTSMSTPVVAGAAAAMLGQYPGMTPDQVKARLMKTAYKTFPETSWAQDPVTGLWYQSQYNIFTVGAGYLDIQAALANTDLISGDVGVARSPLAAEDCSGNVYLVPGSSGLVGNSVLWGTSVMWGTTVVSGTNVQGDSVLWGSSSVSGSSVLWGSSVVWGSSVLWGSSMDESQALLTQGEN